MAAQLAVLLFVNSKKLNSYLERVEVRLDRFFGGQERLLWKAVEHLFAYVYRETRSGIFGLFERPEQIRKAASQAKERGYTGFDCLTPFPIHGLESDMGLPRSRVPYITFFAGLLGLTIGFLLQTLVHEQVVPSLFPYFDVFPNIRSYPLNIGGKPTFSWPAMVPICFELTVLIGGHTTVVGLIFLARLYRPFRPVLHPDITKDKFCLWLPSDSKHYVEAEAIEFLRELNASEITLVSPNGKQTLNGSDAAA